MCRLKRTEEWLRSNQNLSQRWSVIIIGWLGISSRTSDFATENNSHLKKRYCLQMFMLINALIFHKYATYKSSNACLPTHVTYEAASGFRNSDISRLIGTMYVHVCICVYSRARFPAYHVASSFILQPTPVEKRRKNFLARYNLFKCIYSPENMPRNCQG